jgi:hypothetical protein
MDVGALAGFPVVDVTCVLTDGSYHEVDSSALAFQVCINPQLLHSALLGFIIQVNASQLAPPMPGCIDIRVCWLQRNKALGMSAGAYKLIMCKSPTLWWSRQHEQATHAIFPPHLVTCR